MDEHNLISFNPILYENSRLAFLPPIGFFVVNAFNKKIILN